MVIMLRTAEVRFVVNDYEPLTLALTLSASFKLWIQNPKEKRDEVKMLREDRRP